MSNIIDFITRRFGDTDANWFDGNCYYFSVILCDRFPELKIYYEPVIGHFVAGDGKVFYDAAGVYYTEYRPILFSEIQKNDPIWAKRIKRDCII